MISKKVFFILMIVCVAGIAHADIFSYVDDKGVDRFVDRYEAIPEQYRDQIKDFKAADLPKDTKVHKATKVKTGKSYKTFKKNAKVKNGKVEIFVTSWCPYCIKLEDFLNTKKIPYTKYDIEKSVDGRTKYQQIGGGGVPKVKVGSKVISGFDPNAILTALNKL